MLIAGGNDESGASIARLELYDPASGTFSTANALAIPSTHSATRLPDGKVLLAGGYGQSSASWNSGERFDPAAVIVGIANRICPTASTNPRLRVGDAQRDRRHPAIHPFHAHRGHAAAQSGIPITGRFPQRQAHPGTYFGVSVSDDLGYGTNQTLRIGLR